MAAVLEARDVRVRYGETVALTGVSLTVAPGEIVALLGPSGSGKTTLLQAAAGFLDLDGGELLIDGLVVSRPGLSVPTERRRVGLVFQSYALWPHMSVLETVAYPLKRRGVPSDQARKQAREILDRMGMAAFELRRPGQLSGGQQQRVGLARALAVQPVLFLFDEPTANLDATLRMTLQVEIRAQVRSTGAGGIYVTHDPGEAFRIADRVVILRDGVLVQTGRPMEIYRAPVDRWVASLTGHHSVISAQVADGTRVTINGVDFWCRVHRADRAGDATEGGVGLRPEWVLVAPPRELPLAGTIRTVRFEGPHTDYEIDTTSGAILARQAGEPRFAPEAPVSWSFSAAIAL